MGKGSGHVDRNDPDPGDHDTGEARRPTGDGGERYPERKGRDRQTAIDAVPGETRSRSCRGVALRPVIPR